MYLMDITIIGAGAVGGYFGARLYESGARVTLVARGETLRAVRERGVRVTDARGAREVAVPVVGSLHEVERADVVLVATEWAEFVELDPAAVARVARGRVLLDGRNCMPVQAWQDAGWDYRALGRGSTQLAGRADHWATDPMRRDALVQAG